MNRKAAAHLSKVDRILARIIRKVGPGDVPFPRGINPYETLVTAVAHQQLTGKAANTILGRVIALYPGKKFPTPEDLAATPDGKLRTAGFSRAKVAAVKDIAAKTIAGVVPKGRSLARMTDIEIIERLTSIRGVGPWTVEMLLIFSLGRPDVLPSTDFGVRKGFALTYKKKDLPSPKELLAFGERWKPHRSAAAWYLWRATELLRAKVK
ncbi:MAG TPA: DNA-3-methyladenine glycosylase [Planctomycetota bacterium]|nr:DNA-3-methyladenine glycosylase [Planctomycetota bacterium]